MMRSAAHTAVSHKGCIADLPDNAALVINPS